MANPTTNYGWPMPTSTDLVTDLPADFAAFGQPVDTSLKALNPETTLGDIAYRSATANTNTRLGIGTNGQVLAVSGGVPAWTTTADVTPLTTKGDLFTFDTADARLGVGTNGQVLTAQSGQATGLQWATPATSALTLISAASFSAVSSVSAPTNSFTSTYDIYKVLFSLSAASATAAVTMRMRAGGTDDTGANYWWALNVLPYSTTTRADSVNNSQTSFGIGSTISGSAADTMQYEWTFVNPKLAQKTQVNLTGSATAPSSFTGYMWYNTAAVHDSFSVIMASGNFTGYYKIYGYQNS